MATKPQIQYYRMREEFSDGHDRTRAFLIDPSHHTKVVEYRYVWNPNIHRMNRKTFFEMFEPIN